MKSSSMFYKIIMAMFAIYIIASIQFLINETRYLMTIGRMSYGEKLNYLDKEYYRNYFYKYYVWLDVLLPKNVSFSILHTDKTDYGLYQRYAHKFDYYFFPRHVLFRGIEEDIAVLPSRWPLNKSIIYSDVVFILNTKDIKFRSMNKIKYVLLNDKKYYYVAETDNKGLLIERSFIKNTVLKQKEWDNTKKAFQELYDINMDKAVF